MDRFTLGWSHVWDRHLQQHAAESFVRITTKHKQSFNALTVSGEPINCYLPGKMLHGTEASRELPAVGDWCRVGQPFLDESNSNAAVILEILERKSKISRMNAGTESGEQVLAANIDIVFVVTSLNRDFSVNRLERYLLLARSGGAEPVVVLSKSDLTPAEDPGYVAERIDEIRDALPEVQIIVTSSVSRYGLERILQLLQENKTGVLVGSSGVGKSTLVNTLLSREALKTTAIRDMDDKGRHTTSNSGLFFLESGGIIIDTPGLREVQMLGDSNELSGMMPSVAELIALCRFTDCSHTQEPGCAVQQALSNGTIGEKEFASFTKLQRELAASRRKLDVRLQIAERNKWKQIAMDNRRRKNER